MNLIQCFAGFVEVGKIRSDQFSEYFSDRTIICCDDRESDFPKNILADSCQMQDLYSLCFSLFSFQ
jgi:hypothetical protein